MVKILLVEDNEMNRDMLSRRLQRRGYCILTAKNSQEGLSLAHRERPNLILMDIGLPEMDGWEITRRLKADMDTQQIPIIALTAHVLLADRSKALEVGCNDYETKPVDFKRLIEKIDNLLDKRNLS